MRVSRSRSGRPPLVRPRPVVAEAEPSAPAPEAVAFNSLPLSPEMLNTVAELEFHNATPIQAGAIPLALQGRDVIGQAQTGSGKTAAFSIPILETLDPRQGPVQALILCPTRELAVQVHEELTRLASRTGIKSLAIYGGDSMTRQLNELRSGPHVVVATPGRLVDHMQRRSLTLDRVRVAVLDEADRMLDMGFAPDVERILGACPKDRQTLLFSATMQDWVKRLAMRYMRNPETVSVNERVEIPSGVRQLYLQTSWSDKNDALCRILDQPDVSMALVFVETKRNADVLEIQLRRRGYNVGVLHGDLSQRERQRALEKFRDAHTKFLIATNVAARGLDIDDISHVINFDVPISPDEYVHRVGRTARAGRTGVAITLITPSEILRLRDVERHASTEIERVTLEEFPDPLSESG